MSDADRYGTLDADGSTLRFERYYEHPPERVWQAVTAPEHQAVWFPHQILGERKPGAALWFVTSVDPDDGFAGTMVAYDPPSVLEMLWGPSRIRIDIHADGAGTRLVLTETLPDIGGGARNAAGWHECLDRLAATINGYQPLKWGQRWYEVHPNYVERFPPEALTLTAPDGWADDLPDDPYAPRFPLYLDPTIALEERNDG